MAQFSTSAHGIRGIVAIVDDEQDVRLGIDRFIRSLDLETRLYASASELLDDKKGLAAICCLVSDVQMPRLNGLELQLRLRDLGYAFPVIFVTAYADSNLKSRALGQGAKAFFGKPFDTDAFAATLLTAINERDRSDNG